MGRSRRPRSLALQMGEKRQPVVARSPPRAHYQVGLGFREPLPGRRRSGRTCQRSLRTHGLTRRVSSSVAPAVDVVSFGDVYIPADHRLPSRRQAPAHQTGCNPGRETRQLLNKAPAIQLYPRIAPEMGPRPLRGPNTPSGTCRHNFAPASNCIGILNGSIETVKTR